ncbi:unnamed protein product [Amoebophrya sp. A25]|nr:unnamed protein product [Amoebophrya sp. A25]|eukprot:GSA25T00026107001.1
MVVPSNVPRLYVRQDVIEQAICNFSSPKWGNGNTDTVMEFVKGLLYWINWRRPPPPSAASVKACTYQEFRVKKVDWLDYCTKHVKTVQISNNVACSYWAIFSTLAGMILSPGTTSETYLDARAIAIFMLLQPYTRFRQWMEKNTNPDTSAYNEGANPAASPRTVSPRLQQTYSPRGSAREQIGLSGTVQDSNFSKHLVKYLKANVLPRLLNDLLLVGEPESGSQRLHVQQAQFLRLLIECEAPGQTVVDVWRRENAGGHEDFLKLLERHVTLSEKVYPALERRHCQSSDEVVQGMYQLPHAQASMTASLTNFSAKDIAAAAGPAEERDTAVVCGLQRMTIIESNAYSRVYVAGCTSCNVYITGPCQSVLVSGCKECAVVITDAEMVTSHENQETQVHAAASLVKIDNSISCTFYLATKNAAIICGDTRSIKLAPYNVLSHDVPRSAPGITGAFGKEDSAVRDHGERLATQWAHPLCCTGREEQYSFVNPKDFTPLVVPGISPTGDLSEEMRRLGTGGGGSHVVGGSSVGANGGDGNGGSDSTSSDATWWIKGLHLPEVYAKQLYNRVDDVQRAPGGYNAHQMEKIIENFSNFLTSDPRKHKQLCDLAKIQAAVKQRAVGSSTRILTN